MDCSGRLRAINTVNDAIATRSVPQTGTRPISSLRPATARTRLRSWLAGPSADMISEADRLADSTISTIGDVLALLRRVTEARRGGVSQQR